MKKHKHQYLDSDGRILEPTSKRYGQFPNPDKKLEKRLRRLRWVFMCVPIIGIIGFAEISQTLTDEYGYLPWWL